VAVLAVAGALNISRGLRLLESDTFLLSRRLDLLEPVRGIVPAGAGIGYLSDRPLADIEAAARLFSAQYALAPRLVLPWQRLPGARWVVGDFTSQAPIAGMAEKHGLRVVRDLGEGVVLFHKDLK